MMRRLLFALTFLVATSSVVVAAVTSNSFIAPQTPKNPMVQFLQGTDAAGTYKTLVTAGPSGTKCVGMYVTNSGATTAHLVTVQVVRSAVKYGGTAVTVPVSAGFAAGAPAVNLLSTATWAGLPLDSDGNPYFFLESGDTVQATFATALDSATVVNLIAICADF